MPYTPNSVVTQLFSFEDFTFTMYVTGAPVAADVGKAVALDTSAANSVKLIAADEKLFGRLETLEDRTQEGVKVGAVARKIRAILPTDGTAVAVGDSVVGGATPGTVKKAAAANDTVVLEVLTGNRVVVEML